MSFKIKSNLGSIISSNAGKTSPLPKQPKSEIGKVYGVVLNENTPSKDTFEKAGGWAGIGTVFYLGYDASKNLDVTKISKDDLLRSCKIAKPLDPINQTYPLEGELIHLVDGPSPASQGSNTALQKYYTSIVNIWNDPQQNAPNSEILGSTFAEKSDIRRLYPFEGDKIILGRKGAGIRFGSTVSARSNINEWSSIGNNGDPITILVNGYVTTNTGSLVPNIEEINKEMSSIYMTSTQKLPLQPGSLINNPIFSSLPPKDYVNSQLIFNSDRVTLNSKKDEVLLFAKTNIELSTDNIINLNAGQYIHLHIDPNNINATVNLGTDSNGSLPSEPVLLGGQTHDLLLEICNTLTRLGGYLAESTAISGEGDSPSVNAAGEQLLDDVNNLITKLDKIQSTKVFTA